MTEKNIDTLRSIISTEMSKTIPIEITVVGYSFKDVKTIQKDLNELGFEANIGVGYVGKGNAYPSLLLIEKKKEDDE